MSSIEDAVPIVLLRMDTEGIYHKIDSAPEFYDVKEAETAAKIYAVKYPKHNIVVFRAISFAISDGPRLVAL